MENASKALIIAGSILIAILIVSLGILIFNNIKSPVIRAANMDEQEIAAFNAKLKPYMGKSVSGSQVNALLQYCLSCNTSSSKNGYTDRFITVDYTDSTGASQQLNKDSTTYNRVDTLGAYYTVQGSYGNGLLNYIKITKNP